MILVPHGAEHRAVRRALAGSAAAASVLPVPAGAASVGALAHAAGTSFVIVGLCGALDPALRVGDVVVCESASCDGRTFAFEPAFSAHVAGLVGGRVGRALTVDRVVTSTGERAELFREHGAQVVEMEGFHLGRRLAEQGCAAAMVRVVSDDASRELPEIGAAIGQDGRVRPLALVRAFAASPGAAVRFIADVRRALAVLEATTARLISR